MTFDDWFNSDEGQAALESVFYKPEEIPQAEVNALKNALQMAFHAGMNA